MKKLTNKFIILPLAYVFMPIVTFAQELTPIKPSTKDIPTIIRDITNTLLYIVVPIAVLFFIIGGFQFIVSGGNEEAKKRAKSTIIYTIVGLSVVLLAYVIIQFVIKTLTK